MKLPSQFLGKLKLSLSGIEYFFSEHPNFTFLKKWGILIVFLFCCSSTILFAQNEAAVYGESNSSSSGRGVFGINTSQTGATQGVRGEVMSNHGSAIGVYGLVIENDGTGTGVKGQNNGTDGYAVWGQGGGGATGVLGQANSSTKYGVWAYNFGSGVALKAEGNGNLIEAWDLSPVDLRFRVSNTGNVTADGTYTSPAADFAELLDAEDHSNLEPGDVLAIGENGELVKSTSAYQKTVAGVYSTKPAFVGGSPIDVEPVGKVPLAVVGIVPVKVTGQNGKIEPGDLLVASDVAGYAMKAKKKTINGTVIGKALQSLDEEFGTIKMLVVLQ
ncbi:MAG: hypothetical protein KDC80_20370 [Saprospiraceae bacterium]|nr:hypothetical protein [Saprospiraceae bacterium]